MSSWTLPQAGQNGVDLEKPVVVFQSDADFNAVYTSMQAQELANQVHAAVALGWSLSELLGRCSQLQDTPAASSVTWDGTQVIAFSEVDTPREKVRGLMEHILFLASILGVRDMPIDAAATPDPGVTYSGVILDLVKKLCSGHFDTDQGETLQSVFGHINERLFFWDLKIRDSLQNYPMVVNRAYLVGQGLSGLRWYFRGEGAALDQATLDKLCHEYIPLLGPYLPPFATGALSNSVEIWGKAAIAGQVLSDQTPISLDQLDTQSHIWYDILTAARNPLSYVKTPTHGARFIWRVARVSWPLFIIPLIAIVLIVVVALVVVLANIDQATKAITTVAGFVALVSTSHLATSNVSGIVEKALSRTSGAVKGSYIEGLLHSQQQQEVNEATCLLPLVPAQATVLPQAGQAAVKTA